MTPDAERCPELFFYYKKQLDICADIKYNISTKGR